MAALPRRGIAVPRRLRASVLAVALGVLPVERLAAQALGELAARARADSNDAQLNYQVARGFWQQKDWDEAEHYLRQAIATAPQYAEALLALGQLPIMRGEGYWKRYETQNGHAALDSALDRYSEFQRRAFMINPLVDLSILGEVKLSEFVSLGTWNWGTATYKVWWIKPFRRGATQLHQGDVAAAFGTLDSLLHDPKFGPLPTAVPNTIYFYHGLAAARMKNWDAAINDMAVLTGRAVQREKDIEEQRSRPRQLFEMPLRPYPTNDYRYALGTMLFLAGRYHQAAPVFQRVLELDLSFYPAHVQLARMLEAQGDWTGAITEREQAVATFPEDGTLYMELAVTQVRAGRLDDGIQTMRQAMKVNPRDYRIPLLLGEMLVSAGRGREAREPYEHFLATAPLRLTDQMTQVKASLAQIQ
jgi:tetratricopeptide (TPR) repeat protein